MPAHACQGGMGSDRSDLLSFEEIERLVRVLVALGSVTSA